MALLLLLSLLLAQSAAKAVRLSTETLQQYYQYTPAGYVLRSCMRTVPSGTFVKEIDGAVHATFPNGTSFVYPPCQGHHVELPIVLRQLPPDYDGWLAYTAYYNASGFDSFLGSFSVPDMPRKVAHILYFFTGLQNIDWIPLVDPESQGANFDIIQPVLQGNYWSVKSWYVTLTAGATASDELVLHPGDIIFGNMTRTGPTSWYIGGEQSGSGKSSVLNADHPRLKTQSWAYNVLEAYGGCAAIVADRAGMSGCDNYPNNPVEFTGLSLYSGGSKLPSSAVQWKVNPKPDPKHFCGEKIEVVSSDHVTISFK